MSQRVGGTITLLSSKCQVKNEDSFIKENLTYDPIFYTVDEEKCVLVSKNVENKVSTNTNKIVIAVLILGYFILKKRK